MPSLLHSQQDGVAAWRGVAEVPTSAGQHEMALTTDNFNNDFASFKPTTLEV
ncbi:hypothetical protein [Pseudolysobacter antarcticus]|uniref:hypothetical protein n=1 Tax=Pseudolysobacter antarcticus TaxID=2511995 RepID=UPI0013E9A41A|nr:hypothetical protein [Pseudolysobacter antarcticus]